MNALLLELLPLVRQGCCCSQLLMILALRARGEDNPALVRAMHGLCHGLAGADGPCGLLCGGAAVLGYAAGRGASEEEAHPLFAPLVNEFALWFEARTAPLGGSRCDALRQGLAREAGREIPSGTAPDPALCGNLLAECWEKILDLLTAYDIPLERP